MTDRERLIELICDTPTRIMGGNMFLEKISEEIADYLLSNGVIVPIRCKDCKHYRPQTQSAHWKNTTNYCCRTVAIKMKPTDYCSYGELKERER